MDVVRCKVIQLSLLVVQILFSASIVGAYTGWFRHDMDLLKTVSLVGHLLLVFIIVLPSHVYLFLLCRKGAPVSLGLKVCFIATALCLVLTVAYNLYIFGGVYSQKQGRVGLSHKHEFVDSQGRRYEYWVELENPFLESHKERLIISRDGEEKVIYMTLKNDSKSYSVGPKDLALKEEGSDFLLESNLKVDTRFILFNYDSGQVISNWVGEGSAGDL